MYQSVCLVQVINQLFDSYQRAQLSQSAWYRLQHLSQVMEGASYMREVGDEPMIEVYEAQEGLNLGDVLWGWPVLDASDFDGIREGQGSRDPWGVTGKGING